MSRLWSIKLYLFEGKTTMLEDTVKIMDFEEGLLDDDEVIELFQGLIDSGLVWELQSKYGRLAGRLIVAGKCTQ
jgi:hypothetical protein